MSTTLVTAIYHSEREGDLGGRSWQEHYYFASLQNIINFGLPIVIFCNASGKQKIEVYLDYLEEIGIEKKWKLIVSDLHDFKLAPLILEHRAIFVDHLIKKNEEERLVDPKKPLFYHTRCEVLCHRKIYFMKDVADLNPFNTDNFCWIDAGITHWGLTPFSKGGVEIYNFFDKKHYYPHNKNNIYTPDIGKGIDKIINHHGMLMFKHGSMWYSARHVKSMKDLLIDSYGFPENTVIKEQLIGGIIGLRPDEFEQLFSFYETALTKLCNERPPDTAFFTEEIILCAYFKIRKPFAVHFDDWPHMVAEDPCCVHYNENEYERKLKCMKFYQAWEVVKDYHYYS